MLVRSPLTRTPVLGGLVAVVTVTVNKTFSAGSTELGLAEPTAPSCAGSPPQVFPGEVLLRGIGPPLVSKSLKLWSVSVQPPFLRMTATVLLTTAVGCVSEQSAAPYPTKSTMPLVAKFGQLPLRTVVLLSKATFPCVEPTAIAPTTSAGGRSVVPPAPAVSRTRK